MPAPTRKVPRKKEREAVEAVLAEMNEEVADLPVSALRKLMPVLKDAQRELETDLRAWLRKEDGQNRFTTQRYRSALLNVRRAIDRIGYLEVLNVEELKNAADNAGHLATKHIEMQVARFGEVFNGTIQSIDIRPASIIAKGEKLVLRRFKSSARRYHTWIRKSMVNELAISRLRNETIDELTNRLDRKLGAVFDHQRFRMERIARTETMNSYNVMHYEGMQELVEEDEDFRMRWDASFDRRVCPICRSMDGKIVEVSAEFHAQWERGGETFDASFTHPPAHPNCRCVLIAWMDDWPEVGGEKEAEPKPKPKPKPEPRPKPKPEPKPKPKPEPEPKPKPKPGPKPKLPPVAVTAKAAPKALSDAHKQLGEAMQSREASGRKIRKATKSIISSVEPSIAMRKGGNEYTVDDTKTGRLKANGVYNPVTGAVQVSSETHNRARQALAKINRGEPVAMDELRAINTIVHEEIHHAGPSLFKNYQGASARVEEIATEVTSQRIIRKSFADALVKRPAGGADKLRDRTFIGYSYSDWISQTRKAVMRITGKRIHEAQQMLEDASVRYKSLTKVGYHDLSELFVDSFKGLSKDERSQLLKELRE